MILDEQGRGLNYVTNDDSQIKLIEHFKYLKYNTFFLNRMMNMNCCG